jgi:membrane dipeptidase
MSKIQLPKLLSVVLLGSLAAPVIAAEGVAPQARALHERLLVLDSHLDTPAMFDRPTWNIAERHAPEDGENQVDYPRMVEGGLDGGFWVIYTPQTGRSQDANRIARDHGLKRLLQIHRMVAAHPDKFELALTAADAPRIAAAGKRVVYISMENASPLALDPSLLRFYYDSGLRMISLAHSANNEFADSTTALPEWKGLSPKGRELVLEANRLGIIVDQSHGSDAVFDQLIELSRAPIVLSHSSSKAIFDHPRNIDDERIRRLVQKGGVIQVNSYRRFMKETGVTPAYEMAARALNERYYGVLPDHPKYQELLRERAALDAEYGVQQVTFEDFLAHLLHILKVAGPDHVGFGADWDGGGGVTGMEDVTYLPRITERLLKEGYTEQQLANMWSGNLLRVFAEVERVAKQMAATQPVAPASN